MTFDRSQVAGCRLQVARDARVNQVPAGESVKMGVLEGRLAGLQSNRRRGGSIPACNPSPTQPEDLMWARGHGEFL